MKVRLELHPEAVREVDAAVDWYAGQSAAWEPNSSLNSAGVSG